MKEVVGVSYKKNGKIYYFSPNNLNLKKGTKVIVKTEKGLKFGTVEIENKRIDLSKFSFALSEVVRICSKKDIEIHKKNMEKSKEALKKCKELVKKYNLNMIMLEADFTFDRNQLLYTFLSDERVDFRKLAKDLSFLYKTRIELRQVGVRDKAKEIGGYGCCGRPLCCSKFICDFDSVSINMAKNQNIALNPTKINGCCGRLLCCLKYEDQCYKEYNKNLPKIGKKVKTEYGEGKVISVDILKQKYRVNVPDYGVVDVELNEGS